jgi:hypothetical protein
MTNDKNPAQLGTSLPAMSKPLETLLLLALPASGKSEVRKYLAGLSPAQCREELHIGPTVQLDDFPYVHLMRRIDEEIEAAGAARAYFHSPERPFLDGRDWRTLIELVNEDHADLVVGRQIHVPSAAAYLFDRLDAARARVGAPPVLSRLAAGVRARVMARLEREAADQLREKQAAYTDSLDGKTLVIEFARGGPRGAAMPLRAPYGYLGSIPMLSPAILERAAVLYIWVTPEESRRKNEARTDPDDPGSILHHGVPLAVMLEEYGCDDLEHLLGASGAPDTLRVAAHGREYVLPVARFDNRVDRTSFVRNPREAWKPAEVEALHAGLRDGLTRLARARA